MSDLCPVVEIKPFSTRKLVRKFGVARAEIGKKDILVTPKVGWRAIGATNRSTPLQVVRVAARSRLPGLRWKRRCGGVAPRR